MTRSDVVANWEVFVWALSRLGGAEGFVDVEEVFLKCFELAPRRFAWRTREDLPNFKAAAKALQEAEKRESSLLIKTRDGYGRQLTAEGQEWVIKESRRLSAILETDRVVREPGRRPKARQLSEAKRSDLFLDWERSGELGEEKWKFAELFQCSPDSDRRIWGHRLEVLKGSAFASGDKELLRFLDQVSKTHPDWF